MRAELASLEARIQYQFRNAELLQRALTHSSFANEAHSPHGAASDDNEQLEFLGDSVLGFLAAEALVERYPEFREGELSRRKAHLVSAAHLHGIARRLDLGSHLDLGRSEEMSGGRAKKTLLVDALEALIAAIFLDGGMEAVRAFVAGHILDAPVTGDEDAGTDVQPAITNYKSALQELAQSRKMPQPRYTIVRETGPEHSKTFTIEVRVGRECTGQADGRTKKIAAQRAARGVYERLLRPEPQPAGPQARLPKSSRRQFMPGFMNPAEFANIARSEQDFWWYRGMRDILFRFLDPCLGDHKLTRVLEAGCGTGYFSHLLQTDRRWPVVPIDVSWDGLSYARKMGVERPVQSDICHLPFASGAFDLVLSIDVLPHLPPGVERQAAAEFSRVLRPGGLVVIRAAALDILRSRHSAFAFERQRFTRRRLIALAEGASLRVLRCTYINSLLLPVALMKFRLWEPLLRQPAASGIQPVAPWLDRLLYSALAFESRWIGSGHGFSAGQSLLLVGEKLAEKPGSEAVKFPSLSVFFPAYNDAPALPGLLRKTFALLEATVDDYEVIVINDGSRDNTAEVLDSLSGEFGERLRIVTHPENRGYGGALRSGFAAARKNFVFYTDGDGQYSPGELPLLLRRVGPKTGLVNGYKLERHDPAHRVYIGTIYNFCARLLFGIRIRDIDCDYRLIRRDLLDQIHLTSTSGTICVELVRKLELSGCEVVEVGVHHYARQHGSSQFFRLRSLATTFSQLLKLWLRLVVLR